jgi:DNA topoisomerase-2
MNIKELSNQEHCLQRPDMYIGSVKTAKSIVPVVTPQWEIAFENRDYNPAFHRLFIEIISNVYDNYVRNKKTCKSCEVNITDTEITVYNDGDTIPIEKNEKGEYYITIAFGKLLAGSNFDDTVSRTTSGRNGVGASAVNVWSTKFTVETVDIAKKKRFVQTWTSNATEVTEPVITYSGNLLRGYTKITYIPDFKRLGMTKNDVNLLYKNVIDLALLMPGVQVTFNGDIIHLSDTPLVDYANLYADFTDFITLHTVTVGSDLVCSALISPGTGIVVAFVNGVICNQGVHVDAYTSVVLEKVAEKLSSASKQVSVKEIKKFFNFFIVCEVINPTFTGQEKNKLASPTIGISIPAAALKKLLAWDVISTIKDNLVVKDMSQLAKIKKTKAYKIIDGYEEACLSDKKPMDCILCICEGDSAKTMVTAGLESGINGKKGQDYIGIYPLKGKCMNIRGKTYTDLTKNKEICDLIHILNLKVEADYTNPVQFKQLCYGKVVLIVDSDPDGTHIAGLIINMFEYLFPTLLATQFLFIMRTPIIRVSSLNKVYDFYTMSEYHKAGHFSSKAEIKYIKGLGGHDRKESVKIFGKKVQQFNYDSDLDHESVVKAFDSDNTDMRKDWIITQLGTILSPEYSDLIDQNINQPELTVSQFIDIELVDYAVSNCKRSLPNIMDGLKESQRKILYSVFKKKLNFSGKTIKVAQLIGYTAEQTNYHHGEANLEKTITKMTHDFPNSNNIPYLFQGGQCGTRIGNGTDAAAGRYIFTKLAPLTRAIFLESDDEILDYISEENMSIEPEYFAPIIPMILVNGAQAMATGFSTDIPLYNPRDVIAQVRNYLKNEPIIDLIPWYQGFKGEIKTVTKQGQISYTTHGVYTIKQSASTIKIVVTEIPIGFSISSFKRKVEEYIVKEVFKKVENRSTDLDINITIYSSESMETITPALNKLMKSSISITNMVAWDSKGKIKSYNSTSEIIREFCEVRFSLYAKRKAMQLDRLERECIILDNKIRFCKAVSDRDSVSDTNVFDISKISEEDLNIYLEQNHDKVENGSGNMDYHYLLDMNIRQLTPAKVIQLKEKLAKVTAEYDELMNKSEAEIWESDLSNLESGLN